MKLQPTKSFDFQMTKMNEKTGDFSRFLPLMPTKTLMFFHRKTFFL